MKREMFTIATFALLCGMAAASEPILKCFKADSPEAVKPPRNHFSIINPSKKKASIIVLLLTATGHST
jgi:hypothetical protein